MRKISENRSSFENSTKEGLFSKGCSRICNLTYNYCFLFPIVGILILLILLPIFNIIWIIINIFLATSTFMWVFIYLQLCHLFRWGYDYEKAKRFKMDQKYRYYWYEMLHFSRSWFPVF